MYNTASQIAHKYQPNIEKKLNFIILAFLVFRKESWARIIPIFSQNKNPSSDQSHDCFGGIISNLIANIDVYHRKSSNPILVKKGSYLREKSTTLGHIMNLHISLGIYKKLINLEQRGRWI